MIRMPQRSVTRFFIPLIDVLTLLFCIYLLMPLVKNPEEALSEGERRALDERLRELEAELARKGEERTEVTEQLRAEIERLKKEKVRALKERLSVRVLEIDPQTGKLFYRDADVVPLPNQAAVQQLIERDRRERGGGQKEVYYLILYPRDRDSGYPTRKQRSDYDRWFDGVPLGYDIPGVEGQS